MRVVLICKHTQSNTSEKKAKRKLSSDASFKVEVTHLKLRPKYCALTRVSRFWFCRDNTDDILIKSSTNPQASSLSNCFGEGWCISTKNIIHQYHTGVGLHSFSLSWKQVIFLCNYRYSYFGKDCYHILRNQSKLTIFLLFSAEKAIKLGNCY